MRGCAVSQIRDGRVGASTMGEGSVEQLKGGKDAKRGRAGICNICADKVPGIMHSKDPSMDDGGGGERRHMLGQMACDCVLK